MKECSDVSYRSGVRDRCLSLLGHKKYFSRIVHYTCVSIHFKSVDSNGTQKADLVKSLSRKKKASPRNAPRRVDFSSISSCQNMLE